MSTHLHHAHLESTYTRERAHALTHAQAPRTSTYACASARTRTAARPRSCSPSLMPSPSLTLSLSHTPPSLTPSGRLTPSRRLRPFRRLTPLRRLTPSFCAPVRAVSLLYITTQVREAFYDNTLLRGQLHAPLRQRAQACTLVGTLSSSHARPARSSPLDTFRCIFQMTRTSWLNQVSRGRVRLLRVNVWETCPSYA
eukprot:859474-Pleurochrysis_carterae.AAC.3